MYYINATPNELGNYGNPMGKPFPGSVDLPDGLLSDYIAAKGFVLPVIENGQVESLVVNEEALDAYNAEHPDIPEPEPSEGLDVWDELAKAIREGVDSV